MGRLRKRLISRGTKTLTNRCTDRHPNWWPIRCEKEAHSPRDPIHNGQGRAWTDK